MIWKKKQMIQPETQDLEKLDDLETRKLVYSMSNRLEELAESVMVKSKQLRRETLDKST